MRTTRPRNEGYSAEKSQSDKDSDEGNKENDDAFLVDRIVRNVGSRAHSLYVERYYWYSKENNTVEPPQHLHKHFIDATWRRPDKQRKEKALLRVF